MFNRLSSASEWVSDLDRGVTLPADWYTNPAILKLEQDAIFNTTWQYVGITHDLQNPGDYLTCQRGNVPIVVLRDADHQLRAFVNVCRHRMAEVAQGTGQQMTLQCPYHGWTYNLDGSLRAAPRCDRESSFDPVHLGLIPVRVETWEFFVFINLHPDAEPLAACLGVIPEVLAKSGIDFSTLKRHKRTEFDMSANWKIVAENYLECYHCPVAHPGFTQLFTVDPACHRTKVQNYALTAQVPLQSAVQNGQISSPYDVQGTVKDGLFTMLWPNFTCDILPGRSNLLVNWFIPVSPQRTYGVFEYFFEEEVDPQFKTEFTEFLDEVGQEDVALVESVQRGMASGMVPHGQLILESERLVQYFQKLVYQALR